jgi:hypothetical protein
MILFLQFFIYKWTSKVMNKTKRFKKTRSSIYDSVDSITSTILFNIKSTMTFLNQHLLKSQINKEYLYSFHLQSFYDK